MVSQTPVSTTSLTPENGPWARWALVVLALAALGLAAWYTQHPTPLPEPGATVEATAQAGASTYVGVLAAGDRTLHLRSVSVDVEGGDLVSLVCRDGAVAVTTDPTPFCSSVDEAAGATLNPGDQLMLEVTGDAGSVQVGPTAVDFREGIQWGTGTTGRPITLTILD